jgi:hypothetical protein
MNTFRPPIPKEHGAWAVLFVPLIVGGAVAGHLTVDHLFLGLSALLAFLGTVPIQTLLRQRFAAPQSARRVQQAAVWGTVYLVGSCLALAPLLLNGFVLLPVLAAFGALAFAVNFLLTRVHPKTVVSDVIAVAGLCLGAPASCYISTGRMNHTAAVLWLLHVLFFGCSVFYVQMKINAVSSRKSQLRRAERVALGRHLLLYLAMVLVFVSALVTQKVATPYVLLAFTPMTIHALIGTFRLTPVVRFKKLGFALLAHSMIFGIVIGFLQ